jgi:uncharacterized SAM-binding protein YcdF (DUF218 family)
MVWRRWIWRCLSALGLLVLLVTITPCTTWWAQRMAGAANTPGGGVLIVLAGSMVDDQYLGESSYWRSVYTVLTWRQGRYQQILISGRASGGTPAAALMRDFLVAHGVPSGVISVETESRSTRENAQRSAPLLAAIRGRKVLLTSDYHMPRALAVFRREGIKVEPLPVPDAGKRSSHWRGRWPAFLDLCSESGAWLWYWLHGWL